MKRSKSWSVGLMVKRGMGFLLSSEIEKGRPDFLSDRPVKNSCCGKKKRPESKFSFDPSLGLVFFRLCDAFTLVRIPSKAFHIIQKRHAVTGLFRPSKREKSPEFRAFFGVVSFLTTKPGGPKGIRTLDLSDANRTLSQLSYGPREAVFFQNSFYILAQPETVVKRFYEFFPF